MREEEKFEEKGKEDKEGAQTVSLQIHPFISPLKINLCYPKYNFL